MNPPVHTLSPQLLSLQFFAGFGPAELQILARHSRQVSWPADVEVIREGQVATEFFLILDGRVRVETHLPGRGEVTLQTLLRGDVLGWSWLTANASFSFSARTLQPTNALVFEGTALLRECEQHPRLGYLLMRRFALVMSDRLRHTRLQLLDLYSPPRSSGPFQALKKR
ncbi:MAG: cyclic nucleotide-binding domain-containing protein [Myxococcales bacterium]|jgi:CRP/FNR family cyclic AMP-dependent transcriptional regulator|nr:cyclic nucleotide-binding domain-containing protein [Myxococcales bacterium]